MTVASDAALSHVVPQRVGNAGTIRLMSKRRPPQEDVVKFNAWNFARSWASVALASGNDAARPSMYRTVLIEQYESGVRFVATDSYLLLKAWVANIDFEDEPEPMIDEVPIATAICADIDQRVLGMMKYAQKLTMGDGADTPVTISFRIGADTGATPGGTGSLEGFERSSVFFRLSEQYDETIKSPMFEGYYPNWRPLWVNHRWKPTGLIGFGIDGILRLGKLSALWSKAVINFELGGSVGVARIHIVAPDVNVTGLVMPVAQKDKTTPPSEEGIDYIVDEEGVDADSVAFASALDDFVADCLKAEVAAGAPAAVDDAVLYQIKLCAAFAEEHGAIGSQDVADLTEAETDGAKWLLDQLIEKGVIDADHMFLALPDELRLPPEPEGDEEPL